MCFRGPRPRQRVAVSPEPLIQVGCKQPDHTIHSVPSRCHSYLPFRPNPTSRGALRKARPSNTEVRFSLKPGRMLAPFRQSVQTFHLDRRLTTMSTKQMTNSVETPYTATGGGQYIAHRSVRVGYFRDEYDAYSGWVHLKCWRVPKRISQDQRPTKFHPCQTNCLSRQTAARN